MSSRLETVQCGKSHGLKDREPVFGRHEDRGRRFREIRACTINAGWRRQTPSAITQTQVGYDGGKSWATQQQQEHELEQGKARANM